MVYENKKLAHHFDCVIVKVAPAMVKVPDRFMPVLLRATVYFTVEVPVKLLPVRVTQDTLLLAVHAHPLAEAVALTLPLPPVLVKLREVGEMLNVQTGAVNVAVTVLGAFIVRLHVLPLLLSQPTQEPSVDWVPGVAVSVTVVPSG